MVVDVYENVEMRWKLVCTQVESANLRGTNHGDLNASLRLEVRQYELSFRKKNIDIVLNSYLPYVLERGKMIRKENKTVNLHTVDCYGRWDENSIKLEHPMTFKTLAMDLELKEAVMEDLENFMNGEEYYRRVEKAWKRGYLLYGPPGTGKSSLIVAMANHLNFDIYDLDLTDVRNNSDLRVLLLTMPSRSILVVEDIDCSINLENRESETETGRNHNQVTLSGLLNFTDGLWSGSGQLALNYLGISDHVVFQQIERLLEEVNVTPAEVAGEYVDEEEFQYRGCISRIAQIPS